MPSSRPERNDSSTRWRAIAFAVIVLVCLAVAAVYVGSAAVDDGSEDGVESQAPVDPGPPSAGSPPSSEPRTNARVRRDRPHVVFQNVTGEAGDDEYAKLALAPLGQADGRRALVDLTCERIYFAHGRGLCLVPKNTPFRTRYKAKIIDERFRVRDEVSIAGTPSRARVSSDGRYGATTAFVAGHSYLQAGFSTQTLLIDMARGSMIANLEKDFTVLRKGKRFKKVDFNFWGVTFTRKNSDRFFATLRTGDTTYLLEADVSSRQARVLHENVECPSISPDDTRVAYKKRIENRGWRLHVLDLETMQETPLAETQSVDDQVEWLDNRRILYGLGRDLWVVRADGGGAPRKFMTNALSPAVVRS